ncbi:MAG: glycosyltransferase, partial [Terriglobia bacterium]
MSRQPTLDIIIVNWNTGTLLRDCLKSIAQALVENFRLERVVVVDNNSADGSADGLEEFSEEFLMPRCGATFDENERLPLDKGGLQGGGGGGRNPHQPPPDPLLVQGGGTSFSREHISVLRNDVNRGFAAACNQGAAGTQADYLLFLNPDTRVFPDSLWRPLEFLEQKENARFGICGVRHVDDSGVFSTSCARFPTLRIFFGQMTGLSRLFPNGFPSHLMRESECMESREVD